MKKTFLILSAIMFLTLTCNSFGQHTQSGTFFANAQTPGYNLQKNEGDRSVSIEVSFAQPFDIKPDIIVSVSQVEAGADAPVRYNVHPFAISRDGFIIKVSTWSNSKILQIGGGWIAVSK